MKYLVKFLLIIFLASGSIYIINACKKEKDPTPPVVTTVNISTITQTSAVSGGNVTDNGGDPVIVRGVCWNTSPVPRISDNITSDGSGTGAFTSSLDGLDPGTTYYVQAYATNSIGTGYGNQVSFSTDPVLTATLTTSDVTSITSTSALSGGNISSDGGGQITARGVCWGLSQNPTINDNFTSDGAGTGSFTSNLTGLSPGTTYYVRAYATNSAGTSYGNSISFTTTSYPMIRLKSGTGLNSGASIFFIALSKDDNYFDLTRDEKLDFDKTTADWYIDGGVIPFTTVYKELNDKAGKYYLLLRASGLVMVTTINVVDGKQTFLISGSYFGGIDIDVKQPKGQMSFERNAADSLRLIPDTMGLEVNHIK